MGRTTKKRASAAGAEQRLIALGIELPAPSEPFGQEALVMGPAAAGAPVRFRVRMDGELPGAAHGLDLDPRGPGQVTEPRLYQLIRQPQPIVDRDSSVTVADSRTVLRCG